MSSSIEQMGITPEINENMSWLQDIAESEAEAMILKLSENLQNGESPSPEGFEYKIGPSKSGKPNEVGIYSFDSTASKHNE